MIKLYFRIPFYMHRKNNQFLQTSYLVLSYSLSHFFIRYFVSDLPHRDHTLTLEQCKTITKGLRVVPLKEIKEKTAKLKEEEFMTVCTLISELYSGSICYI